MQMSQIWCLWKIRLLFHNYNRWLITKAKNGFEFGEGELTATLFWGSPLFATKNILLNMLFFVVCRDNAGCDVSSRISKDGWEIGRMRFNGEDSFEIQYDTTKEEEIHLWIHEDNSLQTEMNFGYIQVRWAPPIW